MSLEDSMMKLMPVGLWLPAVSLGLVLGVGALAQSTSTHDPGSQVALQNLLNQGFEVKAGGRRRVGSADAVPAEGGPAVRVPAQRCRPGLQPDRVEVIGRVAGCLLAGASPWAPSRRTRL
jgi:hypothetical protein